LPRKFTLTDKSRWLELYDQGKSEKFIAREVAHCDVRTVQRGLDEARHAQDARLAQRELIKDALKKHQNELLNVVDELVKAMVPPQPDLYIQWQREDMPQTFSSSGATVEYKGENIWTASLNAENLPIWGPFRDHLKRHQTLRELVLWRRDVVEHLKARVALQKRLVALLEEETGLTVESPGIQCIESIATHELYRIAIRKVLGYSEGLYTEKDIEVSNAGEVMLKGHLLARVGEGKEERCKNSILMAMKKILESPEAAEVSSTLETLSQDAARIKKRLQEISMVGFLPGKCDICEQIGL